MIVMTHTNLVAAMSHDERIHWQSSTWTLGIDYTTGCLIGVEYCTVKHKFHVTELIFSP